MGALNPGAEAFSRPQGRRGTARVSLVVALLAGGIMLTACAGGDAGPVGQTVYAADVEPTTGRVQSGTAAALPSYAALPAAEATGDISAQTAVAPAATSVADAGGPVVTQPPQITAPAPASPTIVRQPAPASPIANAPEPAPPPVEEAETVETVRVIPDPSTRPERPTDYPNLADVPGNPGNLPTADETAAIRAELEADRDAINRGETPPSVSDGSLMRDARERLGSLLSSSAPGGTASVTFEAGSSSLSLDALATLQSVALSQRETGDDVRLIGFAYASSEANRPAALGIALDRANTVARALVSYGADPSAISVFANALTDTTQQGLASSRRVDITFQ